MNPTLIHSTLAEISIYLDPPTIDEIKKFADTFLGDAWQVQPKLYIYACTAIVCECKKMPAVQPNFQVPYGVSVEKVMKYYKGSSKQDFVSAISRVAQKWPTCPPQLLSKLENLKFSLRVFKKYGQACKLIGEKLNIESNANFLISSLFWVIYALSKLKNNESESIEVTAILPELIQDVYFFYLGFSCNDGVKKAISRYFNLPNLKNEAVSKDYARYKKMFTTILTESCQSRFSIQVKGFSFLLQKPAHAERLLDDLTNDYAKQLQGAPQFSIDQISFLQLNKDLTPEAMRQNFQGNPLAISQQIHFDDKKTSNYQQTPQDGARAKKPSDIEQTPLTMRMQNLAWIRDCIQNVDDTKLQNVEKYFKKYNAAKFQDFYGDILCKLDQIIQEFSQSCKDLLRRRQQIYKFFAFCINIAIEMYNEQVKKIFESNTAILSIICLCTQIFNFVYKAFTGKYSRYCQIFQIDFVNAFWPINWFGYFLKLPKAVDDHLYELQRRFLLKQIWQTDLGYKIITNHEQVVKINEYRMMTRLQHHILCRIDQICRYIVCEKVVKKSYNMVVQLLEKKPELMLRNNIDQIIVCSITACLSINQDSNKLSLENVFTYYSKASLSDQEDKHKLFDKQNKEINIIDFYNHVFLEELKQIVQEYPEASNFLNTPKRLQLSQRGKETPIKTIIHFEDHKQPHSVFFKKRIENVQQARTYQDMIANKIKMSGEGSMVNEAQESEMQDESQDVQS